MHRATVAVMKTAAVARAIGFDLDSVGVASIPLISAR
jgi:hypothetical protein